MFEGFSFACPSQHRPSSSGCDSDMRDSISLLSPRAASTRSSERYPSSPSTYLSVAESQQFDQHSLQARAQSPYSDLSDLRDSEHSIHSGPISLNDYPNHVRQRRHITRHQYTFAHLPRISALMEDMLHDGSHCYTTTHPSLSNGDQSPHSSPGLPSYGTISSNPLYDSTTYFATTSFPSSSSSADDSGYDSASDVPPHHHAYRPDRRKRRNGSMTDLSAATQRCVFRQVRMRKRDKRRILEEGQVREG
ncbi:hypothetical protein MMC08_004082 [Hypocenomyce scalaris]|nr:hypothetical protein [Hypocenomyce scalaris]